MKGQQDGTSDASAAYYSIDQRSKDPIPPHPTQRSRLQKVCERKKKKIAVSVVRGVVCFRGKGPSPLLSGIRGGTGQRKAQAY